METNVEELLIDLSERIRREYGFRDEKSRAGGVGSSEWYRVDMLKVDGETFQQMLARLLREKGMTGPEVYKKVGIDRRTWAKIASVKHNCTPEKRTVLAAALGMRLDLADTTALLASAGHAFQPSVREDMLIRHFIENGLFDIIKINERLCEEKLDPFL